LLAGLTIFPIVFSNPELSVSSGPGLLFETLPVAFHALPLGNMFASIFFILISIAAISSSVSLIEPFAAWIEEKSFFSRVQGVIFLGSIAWLLGLGSIFSFNIWSNSKFYGFNFLDLMDFITNNLMLPLGGLAICILVGWVINLEEVKKEIKISDALFKIFLFCLRFVAPIAIAIIFLSYFI